MDNSYTSTVRRPKRRTRRQSGVGKGREIMTVAEYFQTPETVTPQELIYGVMRVADAPFVSHQRIVLRLALALTRHVEPRRLGEVLVAPVDVVLDADRALVVQPDLLFVSAARASIVSERVRGVPDLVIEVLSPRPRIGDLDERVHWFAAYGAREIWLIDQTRRSLDVLECGNGQVERRTAFTGSALVESGVLPDLDLSMTDVFGY